MATILSSCGTERRRTGKNRRFAEKSPKEVEEAEEAEVRSRSRAFSFGFDFRITSSKRLAAENLDRVTLTVTTTLVTSFNRIKQAVAEEEDEKEDEAEVEVAVEAFGNPRMVNRISGPRSSTRKARRSRACTTKSREATIFRNTTMI